MSIALGFILKLSGVATASMPREEYLKTLKIAQTKVERESSARNTPGALSSSIIKMLFGRYYQVGDRWEVAATYQRSHQDAQTAEPGIVHGEATVAGIFEYEVAEVRPGAEPEVVLKVTQKSSYGVPLVDKKVQYLKLTMNDRMLQSKKAYSMTGRTELVNVSPDGIHSAMTLLELFPLDVPEVTTAERHEVTAVPQLPQPLQRISESTGYAPNLARSQWFEQDDFFGRPVQILWEQGNPWPSYLKTANGTAILISTHVEANQ